MAGLKNNYQFEFTDTLTTSGTSVRISNEKENNAVATFTNQYISVRSEDNSIVERMKGSAAAGTLTLTMRGLDQSDTDTQDAGLKKERREGSKAFVTYVASQHVDPRDDNTFSGTQTFTNVIVGQDVTIGDDLTVAGDTTLNGKYKGPSVADVAARNAMYPTPVDGNMVQVETIGLQYYKTSAGGWITLDEGTPTPDATEVVKGKARIATQTEVDEGTSDTTIVTPLTLINMIGFGDGSDGDVTIAGTVTLTRDMYYNNLVIPISTILNPNGYRIFVKGTLTGAGKIQRNGNAGSVGGGGGGGAGGAGGSSLNQGSLNADIGGSPGGAGNLGGAGTAGSNGTASNPSYTNINGASGGAGGAGLAGPGAGGTGGTATRGDLYNVYLSLGKILGGLFFPASINQFATQYKTCGGAGGGGGGAGQTSYTGGGGGGGGGNGGLIWLSVKTINRTGTFEAIGGAGGAGGASDASYATGGGGGAGGSGGVVIVIYQTKTSLGTSTLTGGAGGTGGTGAVVGVTGTNGNAGVLIEIDV